MKKISLVLFTVLFCHHIYAQQATRDTNFITRVVNFEPMPNGNNLLLTVMKFDKSRKLPPVSGVFEYNVESKKSAAMFTGASGASMSPDGEKIVYTKNEKDNRTNIFLYDVKNKTEEQLTADTARMYAPQWSPDGKYIVYNAIYGRGRNSIINIYRMNVSTKEIKAITNSTTEQNYNPMWSPDGKRIVYYVEKGDNHDQIYLTDLEGSFHKNLTNDTTTHNYYPTWISNNEIIYTQGIPVSVSPPRSRPQPMFINADGTGKRIFENINGSSYRYNPTTKNIMYIYQDKLMAYNLQTKSITMLLDTAMLEGIL